MGILLLYLGIAVVIIVMVLFIMEKLEGDCQKYTFAAMLIGIFWIIFLPIGLILIPFFLLHEGIKICITIIKNKED